MSDNQKAQSTESKAAAAEQQAMLARTQNLSRFQLFNSSGATLSVPVVNKTTGETDMVFVQHGGRPKLAPGFSVDPVFASRNPALQASKVTN